jgi:hypothetical protein
MSARKKTTAIVLGVLALVAAAGLGIAACDDSGNAVKERTTTDSGTPPLVGDDGGLLPDGAPPPEGGPTDCIVNPTTHEEIINACTDAVKITKTPVLPLLYPDGGLPPLP